MQYCGNDDPIRWEQNKSQISGKKHDNPVVTDSLYTVNLQNLQIILCETQKISLALGQQLN